VDSGARLVCIEIFPGARALTFSAVPASKPQPYPKPLFQAGRTLGWVAFAMGAASKNALFCPVSLRN
jgi:citrate synthase